MKVVLPGGSGQIGTLLARWFHGRGDEVVVLSRNPQRADWRTVPWDAQSPGPWVAELDAVDVVINLAGRSVNCRYTPENRESIKQSRLLSTRVLGQALVATNSPRVFGCNPARPQFMRTATTRRTTRPQASWVVTRRMRRTLGASASTLRGHGKQLRMSLSFQKPGS